MYLLSMELLLAKARRVSCYAVTDVREDKTPPLGAGVVKK
jgi:hypothetical protein